MARIVAVSTSPYPYGENITDGPGYRAYTLFQQLRAGNEIVLLSLYESFHMGTTTESEVQDGGVRVRVIRHQPGRVAKAIREERPDVLYLPWSTLPFLSRYGEKTPTIIDYVGSGILEKLASEGSAPAHLLKLTLDSFWQGDFLMTSGSRFRHFILGLLIASKKATLDRQDPEDPLIHLVPMSLPPEPLTITDSQAQNGEPWTFLVGGAALPWYDYRTLFEGLRMLSDSSVAFRVVFMGGNPRDPGQFETLKSAAKDVASSVSFTGTVPFKKRADHYLRATAGMNLGKISLEDELSTRTRIYDYIWAGLPTITCGLDEYSDLTVKYGAGFKYTPGSPESLASTLGLLVERPDGFSEAKRSIGKVRQVIQDEASRMPTLQKFLSYPKVHRKRGLKRLLPSVALYARDFIRDFQS